MHCYLHSSGLPSDMSMALILWLYVSLGGTISVDQCLVACHPSMMLNICQSPGNHTLDAWYAYANGLHASMLQCFADCTQAVPGRITRFELDHHLLQYNMQCDGVCVLPLSLMYWRMPCSNLVTKGIKRATISLASNICHVGLCETSGSIQRRYQSSSNM